MTPSLKTAMKQSVSLSLLSSDKKKNTSYLFNKRSFPINASGGGFNQITRIKGDSQVKFSTNGSNISGLCNCLDRWPTSHLFGVTSLAQLNI